MATSSSGFGHAVIFGSISLSPADRSRSEIERTLTRYGARQFMYGWDENRADCTRDKHDQTAHKHPCL